MHETLNIVSQSESGCEEIISVALALIENDGVNRIKDVLGALRQGGVEPSNEEAQIVLIEIVFQLLEALEQDLTAPQIHSIALSFDRETAQAAADLLVVANFPDGTFRLSALSDGTVLLLAALKAAAGFRAESSNMLLQAGLTRAGSSFAHATTQLRYLMQPDSDAVIQLLLGAMLDGLDHPEIWAALPTVVRQFPTLTDELHILKENELFYAELWGVAHALCVAASGNVGDGLALIEPIATAHSQSTLVQGAYFHIQSLLDPANPAYDLSDRFCNTPFDVLDVLDGKSHLCCASWLPESVGDLSVQSWEEAWNSDTAQTTRASIHDGSFRFCNKTACPKIAGNSLAKKADAASESEQRRDIIENSRTLLPKGPNRVNLAYDMTCNLSCPSCRTHKIAADSATRERFDKLQEEAILPLLRQSKLVFITGSGDPFASKNFRNLLDQLGPDEYPDLRFQIMTNGMLFTPREWARFPTLHNRVAHLRISLDAATGPTHELLRRGARWPVMESNLAFAGELRANGLIEKLDFAFTVQVDNYHEMGDAIDLARHYGADHVGFLRLTNWGTFTAAEYAQKAVFMPSHPEYKEFVRLMQDSRLRDPIAELNDLRSFVPA